jgi:hypothetical protein
MHPLLKCLSVAGAIAIAAACGGGAPEGGDAPASGSSASGAPSGAPERIDMEAIFPPGPGRELVLNNCQNCHTFVPIVVLQMEKDAWQRNSIDHRERVTSVSDEEFKLMYEYLVANFNPDRPVPELPKELLETWTSY